MTLEDLYNELGTYIWVDTTDEETWNEAIEAVRKRIREELSTEEAEPTDAFGLTSEDIQKGCGELQEAITEELSKKKAFTSIWTKCPICGRDEKYSSGWFSSIGASARMHCKYDCTRVGKGSGFYDQNLQPRTTCLFEATTDWTDTPIMGLACSCPKYSPR